MTQSREVIYFEVVQPEWEFHFDPNTGEKDLAEVGGSLLRWSSPGENQILR